MPLLENRKIKILICVFYVLSILVQILVLAKVIPYDWVNGRMSESYEAQAVQSIISILIILTIALFCRKILNLKSSPKKWQINTLYVITAFWTIGFIMQLLGTEFERYALSPLLLLGIVSHTLLIKQKRI